MEVRVHTRGGVLGLDREVAVDDGVCTVSEEGTTRRVPVDAAQRDRLEQAAGRLAAAPEVPVGEAPDAVDGGWSEVEIVDGDLRRSLRVPAGAEAPDDVWELLGAIEAIAAP